MKRTHFKERITKVMIKDLPEGYSLPIYTGFSARHSSWTIKVRGRLFAVVESAKGLTKRFSVKKEIFIKHETT